MTGRLIFSVLFIINLSVNCFSQSGNVTLYGTNREYAGKELDFFYYTERIFDTRESLAKTIADSVGSYSVSFYVDATKCVYCQTPLYLAFIFAEPGKTYHVDLPPIPENESEIQESPFFIPPQWHMVPRVSDNYDKIEINSEIKRFNEQVEPFLNNQILMYYKPEISRQSLDSFKLVNNCDSWAQNNDYLKTYCIYKTATLEFTVSQFSHSNLHEKYLKDKPARPDVPSWWEFFNLYFDRYFSSLTTNNAYNQLYSIIGNGQYYLLNQLLKNDPALQDDRIREWVILKEIQSAYYEFGLPLSTVNTICDSLAYYSTDKLSISISRHLKKDASSMIAGNNLPSAKLMNIDGDSLELSSLRGKYTYIGFCSLESMECMQQFEYLKYFYHKHGKYLDICIILPESEKKMIPSYTDENSIPWKFWYSANEKIMFKEYKVQAFPVFYLLDREGKLLMSPAVFPSKDFEQNLFNILRGRGEI